jgi:hypothetical protein
MSSIKLKTKLVKPHFSLTLKQEQKNLIDFVLDELKELDIASLKLDPDFLKYIAEIIENQVKKKQTAADDVKPSKMDILFEILRRIFPTIRDEELTNCKNIVEFLLKNDMVRKISLSKIMKFYLKKKLSL